MHNVALSAISPRPAGLPKLRYGLLRLGGVRHMRTSPFDGDSDSILQPQPILRDDTGAFRERRHGNRHLPLSPLLDPVVEEARMRHRAPKQEQPALDELTDFQLEVASNPYAIALCSRVRSCSLTHTRLPVHFLQPFSSVLEDSAEETDPDGSPKLRARIVPGHWSELRASRGRALRTTAYALNSPDVMAYLGAKINWQNLISLRMKDRFAFAAKANPSSHHLLRSWHRSRVDLEELDKLLARDLQFALEDLMKRNAELLIPLEEDFARPEGLSAFIRFNSSPRQVDMFHGKPCFCWDGALPTGDGKTRSDHEPPNRLFGLAKTPRTISTFLAFDRIFTLGGHYDKQAGN